MVRGLERNVLIACLISLIIVVMRFTNYFQKEQKLNLSHRNDHQVFNFNMSMKRMPQEHSKLLDKSKDWYRALREISKDLGVKEHDYICKYKRNVANWFNCNTYPFLINKKCLVYSFGYVIDKPTRVTDHSRTLLDPILISDALQYSYSDVLPVPRDISDHDASIVFLKMFQKLFRMVRQREEISSHREEFPELCQELFRQIKMFKNVKTNSDTNRIWYDWRFDDAMAGVGCEVHSFDPSMGNTAEHKRSSGVHFHPIGLTGETETMTFRPRLNSYVKKNPNQTWTIKKLRTIMTELGHAERHLDILKVDIESYEWKVIENILNDGLAKKIRQLDVEFHIFKDTAHTNLVNYLEIYQNFKKFGFRRYTGRSLAYDNKTFRMQVELGYVNLKFDFDKYPLD